MASVFSRVLSGDLPGRVVHADEHAFALLTVAPVRVGHTLVVPRQEVDDWLDLPPDLLSHLHATAQHVGRALKQAFSPTRVGVVVAGLEVPHCHLHLVPFDRLEELDFSRADPDPDDAVMDDAAQRIRQALGQQGQP